jgi:hypothetical protein
VSITNQDVSTITITDNDTAVVSVSNNGPILEKNTADASNNKVIVTFSMPNASQEDVTVTYDSLVGTGTAETTDFEVKTGAMVTIPGGSTSTTVALQIIRDNTIEANETFQVKITGLASAAAKAIGTQTTTVGITDDDTATVSVGDISVAEDVAGGMVTVTLTLSTNDYEGTVKVNTASMLGGSLPAQAGDFTSGTPQAKFTGGATQATVQFAINNDNIVEPDETFLVEATSVISEGSVGILDSTGVVTIQDNDKASISVIDIAVNEDTGVAKVKVKLDTTAPATSVQNSFSFKFVTSDGDAIAGSDYNAVSGTFNFPAGSADDTIIEVPVTIVADLAVEANEKFNVTLSNLAKNVLTHGDVTISDATGVVTIVNDDSTSVSIAATKNGAEGGADGEFVVTLSQPVLDKTVLVTLQRTGTAKAAVDYNGVPTSVTFLPGQTSAVITVDVTDDTLFEPTETVMLAILTANEVGGDPVTIGLPSSATVSITSNDQLAVADVRVSGGMDWSVSPYSIVNGALHNNANPNSTLPWVNLDTIDVVLNVDDDSYVDTPTAASISLVGVAVGPYTTKFVSFGGATARFGIVDGKGADKSLGSDRLTLTVQGQAGDADPFSGLGGTVLLNGGADSTYKFNVLPGDVADSGAVDLTDIGAFGSKIGSSPGVPSRADLDGSGGVDLSDIGLFAPTIGKSLPPAPPIMAALFAEEDASEAAGDESGEDALDLAFDLIGSN